MVHEQRVKLVQLQQSLRGDFDELVMPHRQLLREGALVDVSSAHLTSDGVDASSLEGGCMTHLGSLCRSIGERPTSCYAFLCNDSLWYCELLRGECWVCGRWSGDEPKMI